VAIYVIDMKASPPVVVVTTDDAKLAAATARVYANMNAPCDVHVVDGKATVVRGERAVQAPITDAAMALAHNVIPMVPKDVREAREGKVTAKATKHDDE